MSSSLLLSLSTSTKPSLRKLTLGSSHSLGIRTLSSSTTTTTNPYLMSGVSFCGEEAYPEAGSMTNLHIYDPAKEDSFTISDKPYPEELVRSRLVGSSHGWGVFLGPPCSVLISDFSNPCSSISNPKFIPLKPRYQWVDDSQAEVVISLAMSSSPDEEDFVTAVKYMGRHMRIDRLSGDDKRILFLSPAEEYDYFGHSKLMYYKKDQKFYMPSSGGHHLWSWDALVSTDPECHELSFHNLPQFSQSELQLLDSCYKTQYLVEESTSGQRFLVKWYAQSIPKTTYTLGNCCGTKRFMVFREEEDMNMSYTEDIGDLCIFLGNNEPFCLKASSFPGLSPNSIYFVGTPQGCGVYDIATRTPRPFSPRPFSDLPCVDHSLIPNWAPHWIPPCPL